MSTIFHESIEYILPGIFKAYPAAWAQELIDHGKIHFTNLRVFRNDVSFNRGDVMEGTAITIRNETACTSDYVNPVFVWCSSMETNFATILDYWGDRDCVVQITNTLSFAQRISDAAFAAYGHKIYGLQVGPVTYDKDVGSRRDYHWAEGIFQKNYAYSVQKEFRFAMVGDCCLEGEDEIVLSLGCCEGVVRLAYTLDKNTVQEGA